MFFVYTGMFWKQGFFPEKMVSLPEVKTGVYGFDSIDL